MRNDCLDGLKKAASYCMIVCKFFFAFLIAVALIAVRWQGFAWEAKVKDMEVFTVSDPNFWGPLTMLVPLNCTNETKKSSDEAHGRRLGLPQGAMSLIGTPQVNILGLLELPEGVTPVDFAEIVQSVRCNTTYNEPTSLQYWIDFMWMAQADFSLDDLRNSRFRFWWMFGIFLIFILCGGLGAKVTVALRMLNAGDDYWLRRIINTFLIKGLVVVVDKLLLFPMQLIVCTLFDTYKQENHYIMTYLPGRAWVALWAFLVLMILLIPCIADTIIVAEIVERFHPSVLADRLKDFGYSWIFVFCLNLVFCDLVLLLVNMIFYQGNFVWNTVVRTPENLKPFFLAKFVGAGEIIGGTTNAIIHINVIDAAMPFVDIIVDVLLSFIDVIGPWGEAIISCIGLGACFGVQTGRGARQALLA